MKKPAPESLDCSGCKYWREGTETGDEVRWGLCHRNPPYVVASAESDDGCTSVQAWTVLPFWCGEHKQVLQ